MIITNFTAQLAPGGDLIIPADILRELGLHKEDPLTLIHIQPEEGDEWEDTGVKVNNIEISYSEKEVEEPGALFVLIVEGHEEPELPGEGGEPDGKEETGV